MAGAYVLLPVEPANLERALRGLGALGFNGCNITIPHKVNAMPLMDRIDPLAQRIGAINTVVVEADGTLTGRNTDAFGYIRSLLDADPDWKADRGPITVVGAGGAARAVVVGLLEKGAREIRLTNRSEGKAQDIAREFGDRIKPVPWNERHDACDGAALLVNTTSQGMHGQAALDIRLDALPVSALVSDIVYVPQITPLIATARARGNPTVNGLGMLINQARLAFEAWTGVMPDMTPALMEKVEATF